MDITTHAEKSKERKQIMEKLANAIAPKLLSDGTQIEKKYNGYAFYTKNNDGKKDEIHLANLLRNKKIKVADLSKEWYGMRLHINTDFVSDTYIGKNREGAFIFIGEHVDSGSYSDARFRLLQRMYYALEDEIKKFSKENSKTLYVGGKVGYSLVLYIADNIDDPSLSETEKAARLNKINESLDKQKPHTPLIHYMRRV